MNNSKDKVSESYREKIFDHVPLYETRLVKRIDAGYSERARVKNPKEVYGFLHDYFADKDREHLVALFLDCNTSVTGMTVLSIGGLTSAECDPRAVFKAALLANAHSVILAHNHPSGYANPSPEDIYMTRKLIRAGQYLSIPIYDHIVFGDEDYVSLGEEGMLDW